MNPNFKGIALRVGKVFLIETINDYNVFLEVVEDDTNIKDHFGRECGWTYQAVNGLIKRIDNESLFQFTARVYLEKDCEELPDDAYLGSCFYKDLNEFVNGGYYEDMRVQVLEGNGLPFSKCN